VVLVGAIVVLAVAQWGEHESAAGDSATQESSGIGLHIGQAKRVAMEAQGYYPLARSKAEGMTPEWREFTHAVDRICGLSYNYALAEDDRIQNRALTEHWSNPKTEAASVYVWFREDARIVAGTTELGQPPDKAALYERWRHNVATRTLLFRKAGDAARRGDFAGESRIFNRIHRLKTDADALGQRFGLKICTSN
jgi:hypothetical protein